MLLLGFAESLQCKIPFDLQKHYGLGKLCFCALSRHLKEPEAVLEAVLKSKVSALPGHIQAVFIHNLMKLYAHIRHKASTEGEMNKANQVPNIVFKKTKNKI